MAAALPAVAASKAAADEAAGIAKSIINALEKPVISFHWERDPKRSSGPLRLAAVDFNVSTGLILGAIGLGLVWEAASWFAANFGTGENNPLVASMNLPANLVETSVHFWGDLFGGNLGGLAKDVTGGSGATQTVKVPATFGAAYNAMLRDLTVALPGTAAQQLQGLVTRFFPPP